MEFNYPLIVDGSTGTQLQKLGFHNQTSTEAWVMENPDSIKTVQKKYIENGSDIVYACTFGANSVKLAERGMENRLEEMNTALVSFSKEVANGKAMVAGDISPIGKFLYPMGDYEFEDMVDVYAKQAKVLEDAGVDLFIVETMMTVAEARAAVLGIRSVSDKPIFVTFTIEMTGRTMTGTDAPAALVTLEGMGITAFGMNCSVGPADMLKQHQRLSEYATVPLIAKPNAGMPEMVDGVAVYHLEPSEFVKYVQDFADAGVKIFGGCCGTTEEHIKALYDATRNLTMKDPLVDDGSVFFLTTEKNVFKVPSDLEILEEDILECSEDLQDDLYDEEDKDSPVTAIKVESEEDLEYLGECLYALEKPLCVCCEDADLLEQVLRMYQGRAMYHGDLEESVLSVMKDKYGLNY